MALTQNDVEYRTGATDAFAAERAATDLQESTR